jgi:hypothetical protein
VCSSLKPLASSPWVNAKEVLPLLAAATLPPQLGTGVDGTIVVPSNCLGRATLTTQGQGCAAIGRTGRFPSGKDYPIISCFTRLPLCLFNSSAT